MPTDNRKRKKRKEKHLTVDAYSKNSMSADDDKNILKMARKNPQVDLRHEKTSHEPQNGSNDGHDSSGISQEFAKDPLNKRKRHKKQKRKLKTNLDLQKPKDEVDNSDRSQNKMCLPSEANASDDVKDKRKRKITVDSENIGKVSEECIVKKKKKRKHLTPAAEFSESQNSFVAMGPEEKQTLEDNFGVKHMTVSVDACSKKSKSADDDKNSLKMARKNPRVDLRHEKTSHVPQNSSNDGHDSSGISQEFAKDPLNKKKRHKKQKRKLKTNLDLQEPKDEVDNSDRSQNKMCLPSEANASDDVKDKRKRKITVDSENIGKVSEECIVKKKKKRKHITPAAEFSESQNSFVAMGPEEKQTLEDNFRVKHLAVSVDAYSKKSKSADDDKNFLKMARKNPRVDLRHEKTSHEPQNGSNDGHDSSGISQEFAKDPLNKRKRHKKQKRKFKTNLDLQEPKDEVDNSDRSRDKLCLPSEANASDDVKDNRKRKITVDSENIGKVSEECIVKKKKKRKHLTPAAEFSESQKSFKGPEEKQTLEDNFGVKTSQQKFVDSDVAQKTIQRTSTDTHETNKSRSPEKAKKKRKKAKTPESNPSSSNDPSSASSSNGSRETGETHTFKGDNFEFVGLVTGGVEEKPSSGRIWSLPDSDDEDKEWMKDLPFDLNIGLTVCREGIDLKKGRWSGLEDNILRENVKEFCKKHKIQDPRPMILPVLYSDSREISIFNRATNFHLRICKGIRRLPYDTYIRARKIFDEQNYKGKFTEEELATIRRLKQFHGNKWNRIGRQIGRAGQAVFDRFRNTKNGKVRGTWSEEEMKQLTQAIKTVTECDNDDILHELVGIPWRKVHLMVPTRTLPQCAVKWKDHLCWKVGNRNKHRWTSADSIKLIESIYELEVNEETDIDWVALHKKFWERCPSSMKLKKVWGVLKLKYLSKNYHFMTYEEILDELYQKALPVLWKRAEKLTRIKSAEFVADSGDDSSNLSEDEWL